MTERDRADAFRVMDQWVPANTPPSTTVYAGRTYIYVRNDLLGQHAWQDTMTGEVHSVPPWYAHFHERNTNA